VSGDAGAEFEKQSPEAIVQRVLGVLERIFKPKGISVPQPVQVLRLQICHPEREDEKSIKQLFASKCQLASLGTVSCRSPADQLDARRFRYSVRAERDDRHCMAFWQLLQLWHWQHAAPAACKPRNHPELLLKFSSNVS
jgi:hypothetical protein